jgi:predicted nucleic acid-binding protein
MLEFLGGNRAYLKYIPGTELGTSILNLIELYYHALRDGGEKKADDSYRFFRQYEMQVKPMDIRNSMKFRLSSRARKTDLSYADAIGYSMADRLNMKFLTGDNAFYDMPNVEFVK